MIKCAEATIAKELFHSVATEHGSISGKERWLDLKEEREARHMGQTQGR